MPVAQTLHEIALDKARKRPELVDFLTEEAPILALLKWIPATHGLWNVEEVLDNIKGASFTELGAPLPTMNAETAAKTPSSARRAWIRNLPSGATTGAGPR